MSKLQPNTLLLTLRVAPSIWASLHNAVEQTNDSSVMLWQGMSKTHSDGPVNPGLFARGQYDDHPGPPPTEDKIKRIQKALRNPESVVHVFNSAAGKGANDRLLCAMGVLSHLIEEYKNKGGARAIVYHMLYDSAGRNDKVHQVKTTLASGQTVVQSEHNTPFGVMLPIMLRRIGVDFLTAIDPHSYLTIQNYERPFRNQSVTILSNIEHITTGIMHKHRSALLDGSFRLGAPDGWDKKDKPLESKATDRIREVAQIIWNHMPELHDQHVDFPAFLQHIQFGIIKQRRSAYPGQQAKPEVIGFEGNVRDCVCVLIDDLSDTGGSLIQSGMMLRKQGARRVDAGICHGPPSDETMKKIMNATMEVGEHTVVVIDNLHITNTMARSERFYESMDSEQQRRICLIDSGKILVAHLEKPVPVRARPPMASLLRDTTLE